MATMHSFTSNHTQYIIFVYTLCTCLKTYLFSCSFPISCTVRAVHHFVHYNRSFYLLTYLLTNTLKHAHHKLADRTLKYITRYKTNFWSATALPITNSLITHNPFIIWQRTSVGRHPFRMRHHISWWHRSVIRTSVFSRQTFSDLRPIYGWQMVTNLWVNRPLCVNQQGQLSLPSLCSQYMSSYPCIYMDYRGGYH